MKRLVEFVIPRAVSVLFFKLKATGMKRPSLHNAASDAAGPERNGGIITDHQKWFCDLVLFLFVF